MQGLQILNSPPKKKQINKSKTIGTYYCLLWMFFSQKFYVVKLISTSTMERLFVQGDGIYVTMWYYLSKSIRVKCNLKFSVKRFIRSNLIKNLLNF